MNKRQIAKALSTAAFTPGKLGPMKIIADVGNINYYIRRATEFLTLSLTALTREQRVKYFDSALGLIALAKVKTQETEKDEVFVHPRALGYTPGSVGKNEVCKQNEEVPCTQDVCDSGKCIVSGICPGTDVLKATKEVFGKEEATVPTDDFLQESMSGGVRNLSKKTIPENEYHPDEFPGIIHVAGKENEVDKQDKDGEVQGTGDSVPPLGVSGDIPDSPDGCQSPGQISEETQPRPEAQKPFYAIDT